MEHGAAERGQGDNCRRGPSRCSCKEVLRRDKAPAITIEPRGNSCLRVTHAHNACGTRSMLAHDVGFRARPHTWHT